VWEFFFRIARLIAVKLNFNWRKAAQWKPDWLNWIERKTAQQNWDGRVVQGAQLNFEYIKVVGLEPHSE
jgi:hypothetical protein